VVIPRGRPSTCRPANGRAPSETPIPRRFLAFAVVRPQPPPCFREILEKDSCPVPPATPSSKPARRAPSSQSASRPTLSRSPRGCSSGTTRGGSAGTWVGRRYLGAGTYQTQVIGLADDTIESDAVKVLAYFEAQEALRQWGERQRLGSGARRKAPTRFPTLSAIISKRSAPKSRQVPSRRLNTCSIARCCANLASCNSTP
jgi:hypothetical protein